MYGSPWRWYYLKHLRSAAQAAVGSHSSSAAASASVLSDAFHSWCDSILAVPGLLLLVNELILATLCYAQFRRHCQDGCVLRLVTNSWFAVANVALGACGHCDCTRGVGTMSAGLCACFTLRKLIGDICWSYVSTCVCYHCLAPILPMADLPWHVVVSSFSAWPLQVQCCFAILGPLAGIEFALWRRGLACIIACMLLAGRHAGTNDVCRIWSALLMALLSWHGKVSLAIAAGAAYAKPAFPPRVDGVSDENQDKEPKARRHLTIVKPKGVVVPNRGSDITMEAQSAASSPEAAMQETKRRPQEIVADSVGQPTALHEKHSKRTVLRRELVRHSSAESTTEQKTAAPARWSTKRRRVEAPVAMSFVNGNTQQLDEPHQITDSKSTNGSIQSNPSTPPRCRRSAARKSQLSPGSQLGTDLKAFTAKTGRRPWKVRQCKKAMMTPEQMEEHELAISLMHFTERLPFHEFSDNAKRR